MLAGRAAHALAALNSTTGALLHGNCGGCTGRVGCDCRERGGRHKRRRRRDAEREDAGTEHGHGGAGRGAAAGACGRPRAREAGGDRSSRLSLSSDIVEQYSERSWNLLGFAPPPPELAVVPRADYPNGIEIQSGLRLLKIKGSCTNISSVST
eukprot:6190087-Pleurochrysis_carterae.AAC.2